MRHIFKNVFALCVVGSLLGVKGYAARPENKGKAVQSNQSNLQSSSFFVAEPIGLGGKPIMPAAESSFLSTSVGNGFVTTTYKNGSTLTATATNHPNQYIVTSKNPYGEVSRSSLTLLGDGTGVLTTGNGARYDGIINSDRTITIKDASGNPLETFSLADNITGSGVERSLSGTSEANRSITTVYQNGASLTSTATDLPNQYVVTNISPSGETSRSFLTLLGDGRGILTTGNGDRYYGTINLDGTITIRNAAGNPLQTFSVGNNARLQGSALSFSRAPRRSGSVTTTYQNGSSLTATVTDRSNVYEITQISSRGDYSKAMLTVSGKDSAILTTAHGESYQGKIDPQTDVVTILDKSNKELYNFSL